MTKTAQTITLYQGETKQITIAVVDGAGAAKNLTGATVIWEAFRSREDPRPEAVIKKSGAQITLVNSAGTNDGIRFTLNPKDTARLEGDYAHEARVIDTTPDEAVVAEGTLTVKPSPSRA
jgi:hypothetical protein